MFEPEVFRKQMYCSEKSACDTAVTFPPRSDSGNCAPLPPSLRLWCYAIKIGKYSEDKQIFKSERHEPWTWTIPWTSAIFEHKIRPTA